MGVAEIVLRQGTHLDFGREHGALVEVLGGGAKELFCGDRGRDARLYRHEDGEGEGGRHGHGPSGPFPGTGADCRGLFPGGLFHNPPFQAVRSLERHIRGQHAFYFLLFHVDYFLMVCCRCAMA